VRYQGFFSRLRVLLWIPGLFGREKIFLYDLVVPGADPGAIMDNSSH